MDWIHLKNVKMSEYKEAIELYKVKTWKLFLYTMLVLAGIERLCVATLWQQKISKSK